MSNTKQLLHTIQSSGSSNGWSKHQAWLGCTRRAYLDEQAQLQGTGNHETIQTLIGSIFHGFQEVYHRAGSFENIAIEFSHDSAVAGIIVEEARQKAESIFTSYAARHEPTFWGRIHSVETPYEIDIYGQPYVTCRIDLETQITKQDIRRIERIYPQLLGLLRTGPTIIDWKTDSGWRGGFTAEYYRSSVQNSLYQMVAAANGKAPVQLLFIVCYKTKGTPIVPVYCPPPTEKEIAFVQQQLKYAAQRMREADTGIENSLHCWDYNRPCPWMATNFCSCIA